MSDHPFKKKYIYIYSPPPNFFFVFFCVFLPSIQKKTLTIKNLYKCSIKLFSYPFRAVVILSASVERFSVSRIRDFFTRLKKNLFQIDVFLIDSTIYKEFSDLNIFHSFFGFESQSILLQARFFKNQLTLRKQVPGAQQ